MNFLVLNMDGTEVYPEKSVLGFNTKDDGQEATARLNTFIQDIPNNTIVIMATHKDDHLLDSVAYQAISSSLQTIGSRVQSIQEGQIGWSLIGHKGGSKSWITEEVMTTKHTISATINPFE